jgi:hypothetical protein
MTSQHKMTGVALTAQGRSTQLSFVYVIAAVVLLALFVICVSLREDAFEILIPATIVGTLLLAWRLIVWGIKHEMPRMWLWFPAFFLAPPITNLVFCLVAWNRRIKVRT